MINLLFSQITFYSFGFFKLRDSTTMICSFISLRRSLSKEYKVLKSSIFILKKNLKTLLIYKSPMAHTKYSKEQLFIKNFKINFSYSFSYERMSFFRLSTSYHFYVKTCFISNFFNTPFSFLHSYNITFFFLFDGFKPYLKRKSLGTGVSTFT